jgi:hypothetical protein
MIAKGNMIVCRDFNTHSPWWNSRYSQRGSISFLEILILKHNLEIINDCQPSRVAWKHNELIKSIIDVTLVTGGDVMNASARTMSEDKEDIWSDHKMIEVEWGRKSEDGTNQEVIAWNIHKIVQEDFKGIKKSWGEWSRNRKNLLEESTIQELEDEAMVIKNEVTRVLSQKAKQVRICARSQKR